MKFSWVVLLSAVGLMGCSSSTQQENSFDTALNQSSLCCESIAEVPLVTLEENDSIEFVIDENSPVWEFDSTKSYFTGFRFSERSGKVKLTVRSVMEQGHVIQPSIALLDDSYTVVRKITKDEFTVKFSDAIAKNRYELNLTLDATETPYFIVYGDMSDLGQKVVVPHPAKLRAQQAGDPLPIVTDPTYIISANGLIDIDVDTITLSGVSSKRNEVLVSYSEKSKVSVLPDTQAYYHSSIKKAVEANDLNKALSLLDEAKALGIDGAQEVFIKAVNAKN